MNMYDQPATADVAAAFQRNGTIPPREIRGDGYVMTDAEDGVNGGAGDDTIRLRGESRAVALYDPPRGLCGHAGVEEALHRSGVEPGDTVAVTPRPGFEPNTGVNPKDLIGATKCPLGVVPFGSIVQVAPVFAAGAAKYGKFNWRDYPIQRMTYIEAALRHLFADIDGQTIDPETGLPHVAHAIAGLMILLDANATGKLVDNRPTPGVAAELIALQTKGSARVS